MPPSSALNRTKLDRPKHVGPIIAAVCLLAAAALWLLAPTASASPYPEPSVYPTSWELNFTHSDPKRIVVEVPDSGVPKAFWYMTFNVVNKTDREQMFLPVFELLMRDGQVIRSDDKIPAHVFDAIKLRERIKYLQPFPKISGLLRIGDDEAKDGVAIWPETDRRMGDFSIFVQGLTMPPFLRKMGEIPG